VDFRIIHSIRPEVCSVLITEHSHQEQQKDVDMIGFHILYYNVVCISSNLIFNN
jgi:hypothetical protein